MPLREIVRQGLESLLRNRLRSALTMLGIIWGLASVVILLAYGQGVGKSVLSAFLGIGNNFVVLWPGQTSMQAGGQRAGKRIFYEREDVIAIREEVPLVKAVSGEIDDDFAYKYENRVVSILTRGIEQPYGQMRNLIVEEGRYFNDADFLEHRRVVILGRDSAKKVFSGAPGVGQTLTIGGIGFEVIGILQKKIQDSSYNGPDNGSAFVPIESYSLLANVVNPTMILIQPARPDLDKKALAAVREVIARRHRFDPRDEKATPVWDVIESTEDLKTFSLALESVLGIIGALTLGVGGVGVMNIMLVSVTERTREIGLRKALGARPRHLLIQFLTEGLVLTFIGGAIGVLLALAIAYAMPPMPLYSDLYKTADHEGDIFLRVSGSVMAISFVILSAVGVFAGFWPALKAARLDPIEALRYE